MDDERVEIVGEAPSAGGVARAVEFVDQGLEPPFCVAFGGGLIKRLPVGRSDAFALAFG